MIVDLHINNSVHGRWIADIAGTSYNPACDIVISRGSRNAPRGGVLFTNYTGRSIVAHFAGQGRWMNRELCWIMADYPFNQLGVERIYGFVPSTNEHALAFDKHIGCKELYRLRDAIPGGDIVILSLERADCRWLEGHPQRLSHRMYNGTVQGVAAPCA